MPATEYQTLSASRNRITYQFLASPSDFTQEVLRRSDGRPEVLAVATWLKDFLLVCNALNEGRRVSAAEIRDGVMLDGRFFPGLRIGRTALYQILNQLVDWGLFSATVEDAGAAKRWKLADSLLTPIRKPQTQAVENTVETEDRSLSSRDTPRVAPRHTPYSQVVENVKSPQPIRIDTREREEKTYTYRSKQIIHSILSTREELTSQLRTWLFSMVEKWTTRQPDDWLLSEILECLPSSWNARELYAMLVAIGRQYLLNKSFRPREPYAFLRWAIRQYVCTLRASAAY